MRISLAMFGNRVAWRIFARFVIASLVPLAALAALFLTQVNAAAEHRTLVNLGDTSRGVGQILLDKLAYVNDWLPSAATATAAPNLRALGLSGLRYESADRLVTFGEPFDTSAVPSLASPAKPVLVIESSPQGTHVLMARAVPGGTVIARLESEYLSSAAALATGTVDVCVLAGSMRDEPLFCTTPALAGARAQLAKVEHAGTAGDLRWSDGDEEWLAAYWELFTPSLFDAQSWIVIAATPRSAALESISAFDKVAPQALALSLLLTALLSVSQIRRTLDPLSRLVAGTQRLAARDFSARVDITGNDEFGTLGRAMNDMADRLGRQFGTLTTLAAIDRMILSSEAIDDVIDAALALVNGSLSAPASAIYLADTDDERCGRVYRRSGGVPGTQQSRVEISEAVQAALLAKPDGELLDAAEARSRLEPLIGGATSGRVLVVPILRGRALGGALLAPVGPDPHQQDLSSLRELAGRLAVAIAASEREKALFQRAHFDSLTGIPNRQLCRDRLQQALAQARREEHRAAVLFIDLDGFKNINDSLGHVAGDELLRETAFRLSAAVRDTDTVARFGGDEYVAILPGLQSTLEVEAVVARILSALQRPFTIHGRESFISGSIGVTIFPEDGSEPEELLRKADTAMYTAKSSGRSCCVYFTKEMDLRVQERLALSSDLRKAIEKHELYLVYQPQIALEQGRVSSAEALLRWRHPTRGLISPQLFIPIMEETGLIESVGAWVLRTALRDLAAWRRSGLPIARVAVNVTARQILSQDFETIVADTLQASGLTNDSLELELTETTLVQDLAAANARLKQLASRGIRIAIDDFGTGYSSLGYLNELTFDALKIDRAFVVHLPAEKAVAIVKAIVGVAHALGKEVVAEGIESELQRSQLAWLGCDHGQGYFFSPPLEAQAFAAWMVAATSAPPAVQQARSA